MSGLSSSTDPASPASDERRTSVGYVRRAHGLRGAVIVRPLTDAPELRYVPGATVGTDERPARSLTIRTVGRHKHGLLVVFEEIATREDAEDLRGVTLTIHASERRSLGEEEYWEEDLVGLLVFSVTGQPLGVVSGIVAGSAQDRLVVDLDRGGSAEVPFVDAIVPEVSLAEGRLVVDAPEGLL